MDAVEIIELDFLVGVPALGDQNLGTFFSDTRVLVE
jgi:hypothetical protein